MKTSEHNMLVCSFLTSGRSAFDYKYQTQTKEGPERVSQFTCARDVDGPLHVLLLDNNPGCSSSGLRVLLLLPLYPHRRRDEVSLLGPGRKDQREGMPHFHRRLHSLRERPNHASAAAMFTGKETFDTRPKQKFRNLQHLLRAWERGEEEGFRCD